MEKKPKLVVQLQLPDDMESEILSRLPIKSLMRFRRVSRRWNALISSSAFQLMHFDRHSPHIPFPLNVKTVANTNLIRINHFSTLLPTPPIRTRGFGPVDSCRGLVCLVNSTKDRVFICNPSTREIRELPSLPIKGANNHVTFFYACASNQFKVVVFLEDNSGERKSPTKCLVFTLGTAVWREIICPLPYNDYDFPEVETLLPDNDIIHFLPYNDCQHGGVSIHCFHIETEKFTKIQLPDELVESPSLCEARYLMELGGFLALNLHYGMTIDIWLLKDYDKEEWVKEYTIVLTNNKALIPVAILPDGSLLLNVEGEGYPSTWGLRRYDPVLGLIENTLHEDIRLAIQCVESCFSPSLTLM